MLCPSKLHRTRSFLVCAGLRSICNIGCLLTFELISGNFLRQKLYQDKYYPLLSQCFFCLILPEPMLHSTQNIGLDFGRLRFKFLYCFGEGKDYLYHPGFFGGIGIKHTKINNAQFSLSLSCLLSAQFLWVFKYLDLCQHLVVYLYFDIIKTVSLLIAPFQWVFKYLDLH